MQVSATDSIEDGGARENNLYVKNLASDVDDARLERMFNVGNSSTSPSHVECLEPQPTLSYDACSPMTVSRITEPKHYTAGVCMLCTL